MLPRNMNTDNLRKLLEQLSEGIKNVKTSQVEMKTGLTEVKTSQDEMKIGLNVEIKPVQDKVTQDMKERQNKLTQDMETSQDKLTQERKEGLKGISTAQDAMKKELQQ